MLKVLNQILLLTLLDLIFTQRCLNKQGNFVDWWVMLQFPKSVSPGYAYFDSSFTKSEFEVRAQQPDSLDSPLVNTLQKINTLKMQTLAWNDQLPNGSVSSVKAHAKSVVAYNCKDQHGFLIDHSFPEYPVFVENVVNTSIDPSQQQYGQHIFCLTLKKDNYRDLINSVITIRPNFYQNNLFLSKAYESYIKQYQQTPDKFTYNSYGLPSTDVSVIFKNGYENSSIFEDGLNKMLKTPILAETWGRPQQDPWCGQYNVGNILNIQINQQIAWKYTQDHSKWAYAVDTKTVCYGDMNRMESQWKRGGAYYCIYSDLLHAAVQKIIKVTETC